MPSPRRRLLSFATAVSLLLVPHQQTALARVGRSVARHAIAGSECA